MADFFNSKELTDKIKVYLKLLDRELPQYEESSLNFKINKACASVLNEILQRPSYWDNNCKLTLMRKFSRINSIISSLKKDKEIIGELFSLLFSLVMEENFRLTDSGQNYFYNMRNVVSKHRDEFPESAQNEFNYILCEMPFDIVRENYHDSDISEFAKASIIDNSVKQYIKDLSDKIETQKKEVKSLHDELVKQKNAFNFVGLYKGFKFLSIIKTKESRFALCSTVLLGFLAVCPLFFEIYMLTEKNTNSWFDIFKPATIPIITLTFIFIYYFRISLTNYQSIKSQIIQIELRKTLCTFIQKYSKYAKEMKTDDVNSLEKFETIIFSNIMTSEDKIPSTFDGIEQIAKLITSMKGK